MATDRVRVQTSKLTALADAIRAKSGGSENSLVIGNIPAIIPKLNTKSPGLYDYNTGKLIADEQQLLASNILRKYGSSSPYWMFNGEFVDDISEELVNKELKLVLPDSITRYDGCNGFNRNTTTFVFRDLILSESCTRVAGINSNLGTKKDKPMEKLRIPKNVTYCVVPRDYINYIEVDGENKVYDSRDGFNGIIDTENNIVVSAGFIGMDPMNIPNTVSGIYALAYTNCELKDVTVPAHITSIYTNNPNAGAFDGNNTIENVKILGQQTGTRTGFQSMGALKNFEFVNGVGSATEFVLKNCPAIEVINVPSGITKLGYGALSYISEDNNLNTVNLPEGLLEIGNYVLSRANKVTSITIPDSVTTIAENAFSGAANLTTIHYSGTATGAPWGATNATVIP